MNFTSHPASHSTGIDRRDCTSKGKTCAIRASLGSPGMSSNFVVDDSIYWLLAHSTRSGWCVISVPGKSSVIKRMKNWLLFI